MTRNYKKVKNPKFKPKPNGKLGRDLKYSPSELQNKIDIYFKSLDIINSEGRIVGHSPPTVSGLCLALEISLETFSEWRSNNDKPFSDIIKKAHLKISDFAEMRLYSNYVTGAIFHLKKLSPEFWGDKQETGNGSNEPIKFLISYAGDKPTDENS